MNADEWYDENCGMCEGSYGLRLEVMCRMNEHLFLNRNGELFGFGQDIIIFILTYLYIS